MTAGLEGGEWSPERPDRTLPGKDPVPNLQEAGWAPGPVWMGGKSRLHRDSIPDPPARSQTLYRLSYPAHSNRRKMYQIWGPYMMLFLTITFRLAHFPEVATKVIVFADSLILVHNKYESEI